MPSEMAAVLRSTTRSHDLTVVDVPRWLGAVGLETTRRADLTVLVVRADLRGLAAARELVALAAGVVRPGSALAVGGPPRSDRSWRRRALGCPCWPLSRTRPSVRLAAERGEPPSRSARSALAKACREVLDQLPRRAEAT